MSDSVYLVFVFTVYKLACLASGVLLAYMGYRLFMANKVGDAGTLDISTPEGKLSLHKAAPGTFFALFGTLMVIFTITRGMEYKSPSQEVGDRVQNVLQEKLPF